MFSTTIRYEWADNGKLALRRKDGVQENYYYDKLGRLVAVIDNPVDAIKSGASVLPDPKILSELNIQIDSANQQARDL